MAARSKDTVVVEKIQYSFVPNHRDTMEALAHSQFTNQEFRVIISLLNQTDGYLREEDEVSLSFWSRLTGMSKQNLCHTVKRLANLSVISRNGKCYRVNRPSEWQPQTLKPLPKEAARRRGRPPAKVVTEGAGQKALSNQTTPVEEKSLSNQTKSVVQPDNESLSNHTTPAATNQLRLKENLKKTLKKTPSGGPRKKRGNTDPTVNEIRAEMRRHLGYPESTDRDPIPSYGREGQAIKRMLTRGFTREEILACWKGKVSQRGGEFVSMTWVNEDIGQREGKSYGARQRRGPPDAGAGKYDRWRLPGYQPSAEGLGDDEEETG
ncbi:MAG: replication protein [Chloroflexota bacterium]